MTNGQANDNIKESIKHLEAIELKLLAIDEEELTQDKKEQLADELNRCNVNLTKLRNAKLVALTEEFRQNEHKLRDATGELEQDLTEMNDSVQIINTVTAALNPISRIVRLIG